MKQKTPVIHQHHHSKINPIKVAVADDHKMMREFLVSTINAIPGFKVVLAAENGKCLLNGIESMSEVPDICIIDISMPEMNGYDAQATIKSKWPEIKSLAISIYDDRHCILRMLQNGASGFISKQSQPETIHEALTELFQCGKYYKQIPEKVLREISSLPELTGKEQQYILLICNGLSNEDIAQKMGIAASSVHYYRDVVYRKINVNSKVELVLYARRMGIAFID